MLLRSLVLAIVLFSCAVSNAATGKILKVLPHFLDQQRRVALSPSLFERDAYQFYLRNNQSKRHGIRFSVQWKTRGEAWDQLVLKVELRGTAEGTLPKTHVIEGPVKPSGVFNKWSHLELSGEPYKSFGEVTAWRVTLWDGTQLLAEEKSFLW